MVSAVPSWLFSRSSATRKWTWRSTNELPSEAFRSLDAATAHAIAHGFDPFVQYWTATNNGRTTHFRPGQKPVDLPSGEDPR